jgi:hypothetical protein
LTENLVSTVKPIFLLASFTAVASFVAAATNEERVMAALKA